MNSYVIDTNVIVLANNNKFDADAKDQIKAIKILQTIVEKELIVSIDSDQLILEEYRRYANYSGSPGVGDVFFKWLHDHLGSNLCELVNLTSDKNENFLFRELHSHDELVGFDRSDQKFLVVAINSVYTCSVCNISDSDWENYRHEIENLGILIINEIN